MEQRTHRTHRNRNRKNQRPHPNRTKRLFQGNTITLPTQRRTRIPTNHKPKNERIPERTVQAIRHKHTRHTNLLLRKPTHRTHTTQTRTHHHPHRQTYIHLQRPHARHSPQHRNEVDRAQRLQRHETLYRNSRQRKEIRYVPIQQIKGTKQEKSPILVPYFHKTVIFSYFGGAGGSKIMY